MAHFLPPQPNLDHIKNEAKAILKAHERRDPSVCPVLRRLHRFAGCSDEQILSADLVLSDAQFALAMDYGFPGWAQLRQALLSVRQPSDYRAEAQSSAFLLPDPLPGASGVNRYCAALSMALTQIGVPVDPVTVSGDSGVAFILQADSLHRPWGTDRKELDIGWWPLDPWGVLLRIDFLGRAYGVPMRRLGYDAEAYRVDKAAHYRARYHAEVVRGLRAGRPAVAASDGIFVVSGCDDGNPSLLGQLSCEAQLNVHRMPVYPWEVVVFDEPTAPMERHHADIEALEFAVRLGREEVDLSALPGKLGGRRAWELWLAQLEDPELCGPHFYHANVLGHLRQNRAAAATYLREMSARHPGPAGDALKSAAEAYDAVMEKLKGTRASKEAFQSDAGRLALASSIREIAAMEPQCHDRMAQAVALMK